MTQRTKFIAVLAAVVAAIFVIASCTGCSATPVVGDVVKVQSEAVESGREGVEQAREGVEQGDKDKAHSGLDLADASLDKIAEQLPAVQAIVNELAETRAKLKRSREYDTSGWAWLLIWSGSVATATGVGLGLGTPAKRLSFGVASGGLTLVGLGFAVPLAADTIEHLRSWLPYLVGLGVVMGLLLGAWALYASVVEGAGTPFGYARRLIREYGGKDAEDKLVKRRPSDRKLHGNSESA